MYNHCRCIKKKTTMTCTLVKPIIILIMALLSLLGGFTTSLSWFNILVIIGASMMIYGKRRIIEGSGDVKKEITYVRRGAKLVWVSAVVLLILMVLMTILAPSVSMIVTVSLQVFILCLYISLARDSQKCHE